MNLLTGKTYHVFNNGPVYRSRRAGEENVIDFSSFRQFQSRFSSQNFSIKHVVNGTERYNINGREYAVGKDQYLLTNAFTRGEVVIDSGQYVNGICIELSPGLLAEAMAIHHAPANPYPEKDFYDFLTSAGFFEHKYHAGNTSLGRYLQNVTPWLSVSSFNDELYAGEFFYDVVEKIVADQQEVYRYFNAFESVKSSTKKDLLNRLLKGKELMDDCYTDKISIDEIAQAATMSGYYFSRLFKKVFHCSPHRYVVNRRLQKANQLLKGGDEFLADIAYQCGFADIHSFSKAYKKQFSRSPRDERS